MKITAFDDLYPLQMSIGGTTLISSTGSNSGLTGGDVTGDAGDLSVVGLRSSVSLSSNLSAGAAIGDYLTIIQTAGTTVARFATPSNSYGSNASRVSETSWSGANSAMARADHIHDGIGTITASSSNTLQRGTFNLRAGNNISFGLTDSDGTGALDTLTIHGVAAAGGGGGGGSGVTWTQDVNESGASFTNWTGTSGTWSSNGTEIIQTSTAASWAKAYYNAAKMAYGFPWILEAEIYSNTTGGTNRGAIGLGDGTSNGGITIELAFTTGNNLIVDQDNVSNVATVAHTLNGSTWYKLRVVGGGMLITVYIDGVLKESINLDNRTSYLAVSSRFMLLSYGASIKWRNIKAWTLTGSVPA